MTLVAAARAFGGLGLFFFALRFLTSRLDQSISSRFRPLLDRILANPPRCLAFGVLATALVQASNITIVTVMGLVDSGLVTLEHGFFVMLGATFGTTLKTWFFAYTFELGPLLVGVGSLALLVARNALLREAFQILTSIGLAFLGLQMMMSSLAGLQQLPQFNTLMGRYDAIDLSGQALAVLVGALLTAILQSSSAIVLVVMGLAAQHLVSVPTAGALVLGANLGTTSTALVVSLQADRNGKRIALANFIIKAGGVLITLLLFPFFMTAVEGVLGMIFKDARPELVVAGVHTFFNIINVIWWWIFSGMVLRAVNSAIPLRSRSRTGLSKGVRRMLAQTPHRAFLESVTQFSIFEQMVKSIYDHTFRSLSEGRHRSILAARRARLERNLDSLKETVHDLLFMVSRSHSQHRPRVLGIVTMVELYSSLTRTCFAFDDHLERGFVAEGYEVPEEVSRSIAVFRELLNGLWLDVLRPDKANAEFGPEGAMSLEETLLAYNAKLGSGHQAYTTWLLEIAGFMRSIALDLGQISQLKRQAEIARLVEPINGVPRLPELGPKEEAEGPVKTGGEA